MTDFQFSRFPVRLLLAFVLATSLGATPKYVYLMREAAEATKAGDDAAALAKLEEAAALRPDYPRLQLSLARTYVALERPDDALAALQRLADMNLQLKVTADASLAALQDSPEFKALADRLLKGPQFPPVGDTAFSLPDVDGIIECGLFDPGAQVWYFADVRNRCIWQRDSGGGLRKFTSDEDALDGVFKLELSPDRKTLWAATATVSAMTGADAEDGKRSALVAVDPRTGRVRDRFPVTKKGIKHLLGDFIVADDGSIYATDSMYQAVWRLQPEAKEKEFEVWLENENFMNLQGLAFANGGATLYVADYANGIWSVDVATKTPTLLTPPPNSSFYGIDGIYAVSGGLMAIQNGVTPQRVLRIEPASGGPSSATVVAVGRKDMNDLSLGTIVDGRLHFIGNSGWALFDPAPENPPPARSVTVYSIPAE
ncbi:MAG TPA: tetratricopeptide repeat protein [Lacunisphaera sp.]|nr:tetratricopeptide repeat protein [Lacunisphaera sp.]